MMTPIDVLREFVADLDAVYTYGGTGVDRSAKITLMEDALDWPDLRVTYHHALIAIREYDKGVTE